MGSCDPLSLPRRRLARIRCVQESIECLRRGQPLPEALCYVTDEIEYKATSSVKCVLYASPCKQSRKVLERVCERDTCLTASGESYSNAQGQWIRVKKFCMLKCMESNSTQKFEKDAWFLLYNSQSQPDETPPFQPVSEGAEEEKLTNHERIFGRKPSKVLKNVSWEQVVEYNYSLKTQRKVAISPADSVAVERLRSTPPNWTLDYDEELAQFLADNTEPDNDNLGSIKNYVEKVSVSSFCEEGGPNNLTDGDPDTYWESDGSQGDHWINLTMKKGTIIKKLLLTTDSADDNYMPYHILVFGGDVNELRGLNELHVDLSVPGVNDLCVLEDMTEHFPIIEIRIRECKDEGIDTRIHGIKIKSSKERELGLSCDIFNRESLVRYPKLENFDPDFLYRRSLVLQRFIHLVDSILAHLMPAWEFSVGSYSSLEVVRQLLPLSKKRLMLIATFLRESETGRPCRMPSLYINRRAAAEHKVDPSLDPDCKQSIFSQIYDGLKPKDRYEKPLDYRWPSRHDQWWECKFLAEGIIDQGGGFRDSLSDLADELCPSASDVPLPLPYFIRSPNQTHEDSNVNRDVYIPNPGCLLFVKYDWIGQLMGACLRGREHLVVSLPSFIWKKLVGERVSWSKDYVTVDAAEVKLIESIESMDKEGYDAYFSEERVWTTVLSDGSTVPLKPDGADLSVRYEDRLEYCAMVKKLRMTEADKQTQAIKKGLLKVIPQAVLDLLTWQELEERVCGNPEISVEALKKTTIYEDLKATDTRVCYLWDAITDFSNEDRSRFLRFVTGRRRLPTPLYICPGRGDSVDALPQSSTCSNTLYLPNYSSAKLALEKIRYAAYNCIAIDTDMSPWDEWMG